MKDTLLIADGDAELRKLCRQFLTERGYEVETSADGLECLRKMRRLTPAVLVLDLKLRWGGGDGVLAWLREESFLVGTPVITTAAGHAAAADWFEAPVVDHLPKPFTLTRLLKSIRSAIVQKRMAESTHPHRLGVCSELFIG